MGSARGAGEEAMDRRRLVGRVVALACKPWTLAGLVGLLAAAVLWLVVQPLAGVGNDADSATTVLYFDRLVHGQRLEAFLPTTPKPLLTVVYGLALSRVPRRHLPAETGPVGSPHRVRRPATRCPAGRVRPVRGIEPDHSGRGGWSARLGRARRDGPGARFLVGPDRRGVSELTLPAS
jgi:hypothetical protein